jgi:hypothetical protein
MKVESDHSPGMTARLRSYQTYRVMPPPTQGSVDDVALGGAIVRSVNETLNGKGYRQEATRPDFFLKWHVSITSRKTPAMDAPAFRDVRPMPSAGTSGTSVMAPRQEREGTLTLDVIDSGSNTVVWRGSAHAEISGAGEPQAREARIQDAVRRILGRFPPP